jgi:hypothetical protein
LICVNANARPAMFDAASEEINWTRSPPMPAA